MRFLLALSFVAGIYGLGCAQANLRKAEKEFSRRNYQSALELFQGYEDESATNPDLCYKVGYCQFVLRDYRGAIQSFNHAIHLDSTVSEYFHLRAVSRRNIGDLHGAAGDLKKAINLKAGYESLYVLADVLREKADYGSCIAFARKALHLNPSDSINSLCGECYLRSGDNQKALMHYNAAVSASPANKHALNGRGIVKLNMNDAPGAIADFSRALDLDHTMAEVFFNRSQSHRYLGRYDDGLQDLNKAIQLGKSDANAYFSRGMLKEEMKDFAGAVADYTIAIEKNPSQANYYFSRAGAKTKKKDRRGAIEDYKTYLDLTPGDVATMLNLSEVYFINGDYSNAESIALDAQQYSRKLRYRAINLLLLCAAGKMLGKDIGEFEAKFATTIQEDFTISWSFHELQEFVYSPSVSIENRQYIMQLINSVNDKQEIRN